MTQNLAKAGSADVSLPDVLVAIDSRTDSRLRVVRVYQPDVCEADGGVKLPQGFMQALSGVNGVAGGEQMGRIDAYPGCNHTVQAAQNVRQLFEA